jgi:hypothetical protein
MSDAPSVPIDPRRCVVIPSYNSGPRLEQTVREVMAVWQPVIVVIDGSTDGSDAPASHMLGHALADFFARLETLRPSLGDSLFGLRVYPMLSTIRAMKRIRGGRRFDFDTQMAVRLPWLGVPTVKVPTKVHYPAGRARRFRYLRDNLLLLRVHFWLLLRSVFIWPKLLWRKLTKTPPFDAAKYRG